MPDCTFVVLGYLAYLKKWSPRRVGVGCVYRRLAGRGEGASDSAVRAGA